MDQTNSPTSNPTTVARRGEREVVVTRLIDAPVQAVFDAWANAELFRQWWAPKSMGAVITACEIDARTGGGYRITFGEGDAAMSFFGRYVEVSPPHRLVWTNEEGEDGPVTTVTFEADGERTLLTMSEVYPGPVPEDALAGQQAMAGEQFGQLEGILGAQA